MESRLKYSKDMTYDIEDGYASALESMPAGKAYRIAVFIENNMPDVEENDYHTYIFAGVINYFGEDVPFIFEIMHSSRDVPTLTDLSIIEIDEFLDLINLNLFVKEKKPIELTEIENH